MGKNTVEVLRKLSSNVVSVSSVSLYVLPVWVATCSTCLHLRTDERETPAADEKQRKAFPASTGVWYRLKGVLTSSLGMKD